MSGGGSVHGGPEAEVVGLCGRRRYGGGREGM